MQKGTPLFMKKADGKHEVHYNSSVSMNFWCFDDSIFYLTKQEFKSFLKNHGKEEKSEFFIPLIADEFIKEELGAIKVIPTSSQWFGVTYKEDAPGVQQSINALVALGDYPQNLWN